ncbi:MAG: twin-arginine translocation protein TatA/E family subunit [Frankiales bacterium]|nr:twin-arginine translocation protein TatA/E family subunit [Frankiales bacterium]
MNLPGGWELVLVLIVVLVVFGSKRLPDSARSLGRSLRILKAETKGLRDDEQTDAAPGLPAAQPRFDPVTGEPLQRFDPYTGEALKPPAKPDHSQ